MNKLMLKKLSAAALILTIAFAGVMLLKATDAEAGGKTTVTYTCTFGNTKPCGNPYSVTRTEASGLCHNYDYATCTASGKLYCKGNKGTC